MKVDSILTVKISELTDSQWRDVEKRLSFALPSGETVQGFRREVWEGHYVLPRGAWAVMPDTIRYKDYRTCPRMPALNFIGTLNDTEKDPRFEGQRECVKIMHQEEQGLIIRPPGTGKTEIACAFAAEAQTRTLVIVHTEDILQQWVDRIENLIPEMKENVGIVRGKSKRIRQITVATVQTLQRFSKQWFAQFGCVIVDEAHHLGAPSWEEVLNKCPAKYRFGFTANATRADDMHPLMRFLVGPVIHRQKFSSPVKLTIMPVKTNFRFPYRGSFDWQRLVDGLVTDEKRNKLIAGKVVKDIEAGNSVLVLSRRIEHLERIAELIPHRTEILAAQLKTKTARRKLLQEFRDGELPCVLATQLADEALDVPRLNRVHLTYPGKHEGRIIQQIGRAIRRHSEKTDAIVYDYIDSPGPLKRQWTKRRHTYRKEKIKIAMTGRLKW